MTAKRSTCILSRRQWLIPKFHRASAALPLVPGLVLAIDDGEYLPVVTDDEARRGSMAGGIGRAIYDSTG
jgi:hypothetical protein